MQLDRRTFLTASAAAAVVPAALAFAEEAKPAEAELPIVDTHQHLWDLAKLRLSWLKGAGPLNRSYVMKDYLEAVQGLGVVQSVYMEVDVDADQKEAEAEYIVDICRRKDSPTRAAVIGGLIADEGFGKYIARYRNNPFVKGVRQIVPVPASGQSPYLEKPFVAGIRLLGEMGMSFDLCASPKELLNAAKLVDLCPQTRFILDHCGNADVNWYQAAAGSGESAAAAKHEIDAWRKGIAVLSERKSVVCKISGIIARVQKGWKPDDLAPIIDHCLDSFGPDRVMFASDWPVCTQGAALREWVAALRHVVRKRPQGDRRKLWADNAIRFYGLTL
jgi:predicted TIM-barrel fold metal-dependent hydrolase